MNDKVLDDKYNNDNILELTSLKQWIVWRYEERSDEVKPAKVPYNPISRHIKKTDWKPVRNEKGFIEPEYFGAAMSNNPNTWRSYNDACNAMQEGIFNGLGLQLYDNLCGIDIDSCIDCEGNISDLANDIIDIMDTYTEISPSGIGVHILFYGNIIIDDCIYKKNPNNGVEIYDKGRFLTFTGNTLNDKKVYERTLKVEQVQRKYMMKKPMVKSNSETKNKDALNKVDDDIIEIASKAKNGQTFIRLFRGDWYGYGSQSEADLALCNILSFYTGADADRIDKLFRHSGLYREKWERDDYRNYTISKAIAATVETYDPAYNVKRANIPAEGVAETDLKFFLIPKKKDKPDNGLRVDVSLLSMYMKRKYDIKYYKNQFRIRLNNYYAHVEDIKKNISCEIPEHFRIPNNIKDCEELLLMDKDLNLKDEELAEEKYISFKNGVLNVKNMEFSPHKDKTTKKLMFINQVGCNWNPNVETDKMTDDFFNAVTGGNQEDINFLYQILGVSISGYRSFKNIFYFTGAKDSGKSVYMHVAEKLLTNTDGTKDYSNVGLRTLTDETSKEFTRIIGKRANICAETPHLKISNDTLLKQLSGGDSVVAQVKFKEPVEFVNKAMLLFSGNTVPNFFVDDKSSISERLLIYRFKNAIPKNKQIKNLANKMNVEYIIQKAVEQLKVFIENNQEFIVPEEIFENQEEMLKDSDSIYKFYKDFVITTSSSKDRISNVDLYEEYINFMVSEGHLRKGWDGKPDLSKFKTTQYVFTVEVKKHHGKDNFKKQLSYDGGKADVFINMALKNDSREKGEDGLEDFKSLSDCENKIIQGLFP